MTANRIEAPRRERERKKERERERRTFEIFISLLMLPNIIPSTPSCVVIFTNLWVIRDC